MYMKRTHRRPPEWEAPMSAEQTLARLMPLLTIIYELIETGIEESRQWFHARDKPIHNVVFATHVRLKVWEEIVERTKQAGLDCSVRFTGNVGIRLSYQGATIALWKADKDGRLPACGESGQRQLFYTQAVLPSMFSSDALPRKLALLWDVNQGVLNVQLVAPKGFDSLWTAGLVHWATDVPHPAKAISATTDLASGAEELDDILKHKKTADEPDDAS